jgi:hypothetical protein
VSFVMLTGQPLATLWTYAVGAETLQGGRISF